MKELTAVMLRNLGIQVTLVRVSCSCLMFD